jgi:hypothetical protein
MKIIITAGDGFSASHIWPMWPKIIQDNVTDTRVISLGKPAAGNEFIFNSVLMAINQQKPDYVLVQWAQSRRLDLVIDSVDKRDTALQDEVYHHNLYRIGATEWWLSNASTQNYVRHYHSEYIGLQQSLIRTKNYIISLAAILESRGIPYKFFSTYDVEVYPDADIDWSHWIWHAPGRGMEHYSQQARFAATRGTEVQPSTEVQAAWVSEILKPTLDLPWKD